MVKPVEWFLSAKLPAEHVLILQMRLPLFDMHLMTRYARRCKTYRLAKMGRRQITRELALREFDTGTSE